MPLALGSRLGPYEVLSLIGAGGMGEVYLARDPRLNREVAIKVLPADRISDEGRRRRFIQEAQAASALNHPHIITIYEIESADGRDFIAMEYVRGKSLDALIPRQGMRLSEALRIAIPVADALAAAHARGIIHRDLKPANVIVGNDGAVKVLDFGLAKLTAGETAPEEDTVTYAGEGLSVPGTIAGTAAYMSPEQAVGEQVDARSDIFSFGAMLYEMVTGQRAFAGRSTSDTLSAVIRAQPKPPSQCVSTMPRELERVILRSLRKEPDRRFQSMLDVKVELLEVKEESESGPSVASPVGMRRHRSRIVWTGAVLVLAAIAAISAWRLRGNAPTPEPALTTIPLTTFTGSESMPTFSPDGNQVAFVWNGEQHDNADVYVKAMGPGPPLRLTTDPERDSSPAWSPDGSSIAFVRGDGDALRLLLIPALGGPERKLADLQLKSGGTYASASAPLIAWSPDGRWIAFPQANAPGEPSGVFVLSLQTGERRRLTSPPKDAYGDSGVAFSPDGRALAFVRASNFGTRLYVLPLTPDVQPAGEPRLLPSSHPLSLTPAWTADGGEVVFSAIDLSSVNRGLWRVAASGSEPPRRLPMAVDDSTEPAISRQGRRIAYSVSAGDQNIWRVELSAAGQAGSPVRLIASTQAELSPQYSPDGQRIAFGSNRAGTTELWLCDAAGANPAQITSLGAHSGTPRWSPDGRRIVFDSNKEGRFQIYVMETAGACPGG
jgi:serine/threonine protein kinase